MTMGDLCRHDFGGSAGRARAGKRDGELERTQRRDGDEEIGSGMRVRQALGGGLGDAGLRYRASLRVGDGRGGDPG